MEPEAPFKRILKSKFENRVASNLRYSLRAFARDLGVSASLLSGLLNGRKGISEKTAVLLGRSLELNSAEEKEFLSSIRAAFSRSPRVKLAAELAMEKIKKRSRSKTVLRGASLESTANWIHLAILEMCELKECQHSIDWFARTLSISSLATARAVNVLLASGQLKIEKGRFIPCVGETATDVDVANLVVRRFHSEILDRAKQSLTADSVNVREFNSVTLAFSKADLRQAKEMIRSFQDEFCERFYRNSRKQKNSVYQLSIQLFPLTDSKLRSST